MLTLFFFIFNIEIQQTAPQNLKNKDIAKNVQLRTTSKIRAARLAGCLDDRVALSTLWLAVFFFFS